MGKSNGVIRGVANTGVPLTVFAPRHDLYEEYAGWCEDTGLSSKQLPSFHNDCPTASGANGEQWKKQVRDLYTKGVTPNEIHTHASRHFGEQLPCHKNRVCPFRKEWKFNADEYDVLVGHYRHAYKSEVTEDRVVAFDELPVDDFVQKLEGGEVTKAVSAYLADVKNPPFEDFTDLLETRDDSTVCDTAAEWFGEQALVRDRRQVLRSKENYAHAYAPLLAYSVFNGQDLGNGWESATIDTLAHSSLNRSYAVARNRSSGDLFLMNPPELTDAMGVIGLDGTAVPELWQLVVDDRLEHQRVLSDEERREYISNCLNYSIIQTAQTSKPYSGGRNVTPEQDRVLFNAVARREGTSPALISSNEAFGCYEDQNVIGSIGSKKNYGGFKGSNEFGDERVGIIAGSPHYGDDYVKRWGALAGECVERSRKGMNVNYGRFGNVVLQNMREHSVFQALMRFSRDNDGATVYVHTAAIPDWVPIDTESKVVVWNGSMADVVDALLDSNGQGLTTAEIKNQASCSQRMVRKNLSNLEEHSLIKKKKHPDDGRKTIWKPVLLGQKHSNGYVV